MIKNTFFLLGQKTYKSNIKRCNLLKPDSEIITILQGISRAVAINCHHYTVWTSYQAKLQLQQPEAYFNSAVSDRPDHRLLQTPITGVTAAAAWTQLERWWQSVQQGCVCLKGYMDWWLRDIPVQELMHLVCISLSVYTTMLLHCNRDLVITTTNLTWLWNKSLF